MFNFTFDNFIERLIDIMGVKGRGFYKIHLIILA